MNAPGLVVFDLDGTLVDSSRDLGAAINAMLVRLDPAEPPLSVDDVRSFIGNGARMLVSRTLVHTGRREPVEQALPLFLEEYRQRLLDTTRLYPGADALLEALEGRHLAVLTNKPGDMSRALLNGLGVGTRFFRIYGGGDLPARKPDPVGLVRLMEESGKTPEETVLVGDSAVDVRTARAAGVRAYGVSWGFDRDSLEGDPPDAQADTVEELRRLLC